MEQKGLCALTGLPMEFPTPQWKGVKTLGTASLDRKDSKLPYIEGNVQWVLKRVNIMKREWTDEEFIDLAHKISDYQRSKTNIVSIRAPGFGAA